MTLFAEKKPTPLRALPAGERILWQGRPQWRGLALRALHVRKVAIYFALFAVWRFASDVSAGEGLASITSVLWVLVPCSAACGILVLMAWLWSRTTQYTITTRRLVMQFGVALPIMLNIPFGVIGAAALRCYADATGDIPLAIAGKDRLAYLMLWPHVRPWRAARAEPMLRAIADARHVSEILARAVVGAANAGVVHASAVDKAAPIGAAAAQAA
ncbi:MAG TPA: photosynthetic complex putative assembly protein PuhB [Xanthobacteraceae bacterium]|nr:photosynthetic complex putative assembly protein PuhB [Xanthobacteraceae bacterium]